MQDAPHNRRLHVLPNTILPQHVPSRVCLSCEVCCRFPESDSFLRPYFTADEIAGAVAHGVDRAQFPDPQGCQVSLVPNPHGEGYMCPAFDPATSHCRIYEARPVDCQIYPLAVMWSADRESVVLGWDTKCPFLMGSPPSPELEAYAERMAVLIEQEDRIELLAKHPQWIGPFQDDVVVVRPLRRLTAWMRPGPSALSLRPLILEDRGRLDEVLASAETALAAYSGAYHLVWRGLFSYTWTEAHGYLLLFAESPEGMYMPLPPLGQGSMGAALKQAFSIMQERNRGSSVSRIENIPDELKPTLEDFGYRVTPKDPDYLYRTSDLVELKGDRYKSPRGACQRFTRAHHYRYDPYQEEDREACWGLFQTWVKQQEARNLNPVARHMLRDARSAHQEALSHHEALGLVGRVVRIDGAIRAYTFGYPRSKAVFCVLLEVADRSIPGLAQVIFREFCREAARSGHEFMNTMDDSGLPSLSRSKAAYHPVRMVGSSIATEP